MPVDMAAALRTHGFEVLDGIDLDKAALERKIRDFAAALVGADVGVFFYAGHGLQISGTNYLVPIDAQLRNASALDFEMVRLDLVQRTMEREAPTNILFLDACRDNPLAPNLARAMGTRSADIGRGLAPAEFGVGTLISFSTQPGNVALDGAARNSPFAGALIKTPALVERRSERDPDRRSQRRDAGNPTAAGAVGALGAHRQVLLHPEPARRRGGATGRGGAAIAAGCGAAVAERGGAVAHGHRRRRGDVPLSDLRALVRGLQEGERHRAELSVGRLARGHPADSGADRWRSPRPTCRSRAPTWNATACCNSRP